MNYVCGYLFLRFEDGSEFRQINPWQTLMNLQYTVIYSIRYHHAYWVAEGLVQLSLPVSSFMHTCGC